MAITTREARRGIVSTNADRREAVRQELSAVAASQITDVVTWGSDINGQVKLTVKDSDQLSDRAKRAIKKIKVTPTEFGNQVEIEMHDKLGALRVLARAEGLLDGGDDDDKRPSIAGITIKGPAEEKAAQQGAIADGANESSDRQKPEGSTAGVG